MQKLQEFENTNYVWTHHLVFPWKIGADIVCVTFVPFETISLCMMEILMRLNLCHDVDFKDATKHLEQTKILAREANDILRKWEQTPKGTRGCGDLFMCKQKNYKSVASTSHYLKIVAETLHTNENNEDMPLDDTPYHVLTACVSALDSMLPSIIIPSLLKCVERFKQSVELKKQEWDARRHYAAKNYGAAYGHVKELNKILKQDTRWLRSADTHPWTAELCAICGSLRITEATEPVPHRDVELETFRLDLLN